MPQVGEDEVSVGLGALAACRVLFAWRKQEFRHRNKKKKLKKFGIGQRTFLATDVQKPSSGLRK